MPALPSHQTRPRTLTLAGEEQPDPSKVQYVLRTYRANCSQATAYISRDTRDHVATDAQVYRRAVDGCSKGEADLIENRTRSNCGFQLLSPDSVNGSKHFARSLGLLSSWIGTCQESHKETSGPSTWDQKPRFETIRLIHGRGFQAGCDCCARQNFYPFSPTQGSSGSLADNGTGNLVVTTAPAAEVTLLGGLSWHALS